MIDTFAAWTAEASRVIETVAGPYIPPVQPGGSPDERAVALLRIASRCGIDAYALDSRSSGPVSTICGKLLLSGSRYEMFAERVFEMLWPELIRALAAGGARDQVVYTPGLPSGCAVALWHPVVEDLDDMRLFASDDEQVTETSRVHFGALVYDRLPADHPLRPMIRREDAYCFDAHTPVLLLGRPVYVAPLNGPAGWRPPAFVPLAAVVYWTRQVEQRRRARKTELERQQALDAEHARTAWLQTPAGQMARIAELEARLAERNGQQPAATH